MKKYRYKGYELQQTSYNWHYMIIDLKTKQSVFHCSCTKELDEEEMKRAIIFFLSLKNNRDFFEDLKDSDD